ncbi:MAG TPA: hypothetical protein VML54_12845, partial [Candidatus Limnocylindrales bacterium]|nr:hypothetical protein [Candidatus Limnocylindrales bacterium]
MTHQKRLRQHICSGLAVGLLLAGLTASAEALTITRTGSDADGRKAYVSFTQASGGADIVVTLANISPNDVDGSIGKGKANIDAAEYILTGV